MQRGPQGTLGGRNSSAGLLSIYTAKPEFDFSGYGAASYGNYDAMRLEGGVTGPISDTIAARVDGVWSKRDGFYREATNNTDINVPAINPFVDVRQGKSAATSTPSNGP